MKRIKALNNWKPKRFFERYCIAVRHHPWLERSEWLWSRVRPKYDSVMALLGRHGLERIINGSDRILISPQFRGVSDVYEPDVWKHLMSQVQSGDVIADVGAYIGLYTIALAKRVGSQGCVYAFEPDPQSLKWLHRHVSLNRIESRVRIFGCAVGDRNGNISFVDGRDSQSHVAQGLPLAAQNSIQSITLDTVFADAHLDLLKIDVEGFEEQVLRGATNLLRDPKRGPRIIFIEVHPYAWKAYGASSESLLEFLQSCHYQVSDMQGNPVQTIVQYGEVIARRD